MKNYFRKITPGIILAFVTSFMVFIYEPIITYSANVDDFWFDFELMLPNILTYFAILFVLLIIIYTFFYLLFCVLIKKDKYYKKFFIITFIFLVFFYIQGVYLVGNLPALNGDTINWNSYTKDMVISTIIFIVITIVQLILIKKVKLDKTIKIDTFIMLAIFVMLLTSIFSALFKPGFFREKIIATSTNININSVSANKNFFIFLVDAVDSTDFANVVKSYPKYSSTFEDFTYFPDTVSGYTFTRDSIPFIFSGKWNENEVEFIDYCNDAFNNSSFLNKLKDENYNMNFYEYQIHWSDRKIAEFSNIEIYNDEVDHVKYFKQLAKYILFKYLPFPLKEYSQIDTADFDACRVDKEETYFEWDNDVTYKNLKNNPLKVIDDDYFQFIHIEGGHTPFDNDEDVNIISEDEGTYEKKLAATLNIIDTFINRLKENDVYENSVIVIMADHGYGEHGRQNPILYIKGLEEKHPMNTSDIPVSYEDLCEAFEELLDDNQSTELFKNIDTSRVRRFISNPFEDEDVMTEYEQQGKAWDTSTVKATGREFRR